MHCPRCGESNAEYILTVEGEETYRVTNEDELDDPTFNPPEDTAEVSGDPDSAKLACLECGFVDNYDNKDDWKDD